MTASEKPVFVLVHGAWHRPIHYIKFINLLQQAGYTVLAPHLASAGWQGDVAKATVQDDAQIVKKAMQPYLDAGREIIVLGHSYGGLPTTNSVVGESIEERKARGEAGGVRAAVYLCAFASPDANLSLLQLLSVKSLEDGDRPHFWDVKEGCAVLNREGMDLLYFDIDPLTAEMAFNATVPHSVASFQVPSGHAATEIKSPIVYIATEKDVAPYDAQLMGAKMLGARLVSFDSGHSPFAKDEDAAKLVEIIDSIV